MLDHHNRAYQTLWVVVITNCQGGHYSLGAPAVPYQIRTLSGSAYVGIHPIKYLLLHAEEPGGERLGI